MPTLNEFVEEVMGEHHLNYDVDKVIKKITDIARGQAVSGVAALSKDEVRDIVINFTNEDFKIPERPKPAPKPKPVETKKNIGEGYMEALF